MSSIADFPSADTCGGLDACSCVESPQCSWQPHTASCMFGDSGTRTQCAFCPRLCPASVVLERWLCEDDSDAETRDAWRSATSVLEWMPIDLCHFSRGRTVRATCNNNVNQLLTYSCLEPTALTEVLPNIAVGRK